MSQKISIFDPILVRPYDFPAPVEAAWSIGGTPADCVKVAVGYLLDGAPDLVLSGINNGYNAGFDNAYSGTIGAAAEALMKRIPAIAFSRGLNADFEVAEHYLPPLLEELMAAPPVPWELWNVNFPAVPLRDCKGVLYGRRLAPVQLYQELYRREDRPDGSFTLLNTPLRRALSADWTASSDQSKREQGKRSPPVVLPVLYVILVVSYLQGMIPRPTQLPSLSSGKAI